MGNNLLNILDIIIERISLPPPLINFMHHNEMQPKNECSLRQGNNGAKDKVVLVLVVTISIIFLSFSFFFCLIPERLRELWFFDEHQNYMTKCVQ